MGERIVTRRDAELILVRLHEMHGIGVRVNVCFSAVGDILFRRYTSELLDVGPVLVVIQGLCVSLALERSENWVADQVLTRLEQLEDDLLYLVPLIERQNAGLPETLEPSNGP